jgi:hypothetical protein
MDFVQCGEVGEADCDGERREQKDKSNINKNMSTEKREKEQENVGQKKYIQKITGHKRRDVERRKGNKSDNCEGRVSVGGG